MKRRNLDGLFQSQKGFNDTFAMTFLNGLFVSQIAIKDFNDNFTMISNRFLDCKITFLKNFFERRFLRRTPPKSETKFYGASARQRASTCKTTAKKDVFPIEPFHLIVIRIFEVGVRASGHSLFMVLTTCVLGGPPKTWTKILPRERASARERMQNNNEKKRIFDRAVSPYNN